MKKIIFSALVFCIAPVSALDVPGQAVQLLDCQYPPKNIKEGTCKDRVAYQQKRKYNYKFECLDDYLRSGNLCLLQVNRFENNLKGSRIEEVYSYKKGNTTIYEKKKKVGITSEGYDISRTPSLYTNKYGAKIMKYDLSK